MTMKPVKQFRHRKQKELRRKFYQKQLEHFHTEGANSLELNASSVRSAKMQAKRLYPQGCTILGYDGGELAYKCEIKPQSEKQECGRSAFSDRHDRYWANHGIKQPPLVWSKPTYFEVIL